MASAARAFQTLADPMRRRIVEELRHGERSVGELVRAVDSSQPGVSRHLRILHDAGFVRARVDGQRRYYGLEPQPFRDLARWVRGYQDLLGTRFDRPERSVERDGAGSRSPRRSATRGRT